MEKRNYRLSYDIIVKSDESSDSIKVRQNS